MKIFIYCVIVLFKCIIMNRLVSGEYHIKDNVVPSYLYFKFDDFKNDFFPHGIQLNFFLSKIAGTLLYYIDNQGRQMIVTLNVVYEPIIQIEINTHIEILSLPELCRCLKCLYEILDLHITIGSDIKIKCNGGKTKQIKYTKKLGLNAGYPIMYNATDSKSSSKHESRLWLVNTPEHNNTPPHNKASPNNDQMGGCILNASYRNEAIKFTKITSNVTTKCPPMCYNNSDGMVYELPVCNCSGTVLNGRYCNDNMVPMNSKIPDLVLNIKKFMLSWNSSVEKILEINSTYLQLSLKGLNKSLIFEYKHAKNEKNKTTLCEDYVPNNTYIVIVICNDTSIDIKLFNNGYWDTVTVEIPLNIMKESFHSVSLCSGNGTIDFMFKTNDNNDNTWLRINATGNASSQCYNQQTHNNKPDSQKETSTKSTTGIRHAFPHTTSTKSTTVTINEILKIVYGLLVIALINLVLIIVLIIGGAVSFRKLRSKEQKLLPIRSIPEVGEDANKLLENGQENTPL